MGVESRDRSGINMDSMKLYIYIQYANVSNFRYCFSIHESFYTDTIVCRRHHD